MRYALHLISLISAAIGALLVFSIYRYDYVPQQQLIVMIGVAFAVIPYCIARSYQELQRTRWERNLSRDIGKSVAQALEQSRNRRPQPATDWDATPSEYLLKN